MPGDLLEISCSDLIEETKKSAFPVRVAEDGTIALPMLAARVMVNHSTALEAEQYIATTYASSGYIRRPQVTVRTLEHKSHTIYAQSAVKKPGAYELQTDDVILCAIVAAGGLTEDATHIVEVRHAANSARH